ncbi:MAG: hypothetical protein HYT87_10765 [Nitrospirae bacterium]|nr:hypothetical protein [Nitrospirota bacterium]
MGESALDPMGTKGIDPSGTLLAGVPACPTSTHYSLSPLRLRVRAGDFLRVMGLPIEKLEEVFTLWQSDAGQPPVETVPVGVEGSVTAHAVPVGPGNYLVTLGALTKEGCSVRSVPLVVRVVPAEPQPAQAPVRVPGGAEGPFMPTSFHCDHRFEVHTRGDTPAYPDPVGGGCVPGEPRVVDEVIHVTADLESDGTQRGCLEWSFHDNAMPGTDYTFSDCADAIKYACDAGAVEETSVHLQWDAFGGFCHPDVGTGYDWWYHNDVILKARASSDFAPPGGCPGMAPSRLVSGRGPWRDPAEAVSALMVVAYPPIDVETAMSFTPAVEEQGVRLNGVYPTTGGALVCVPGAEVVDPQKEDSPYVCHAGGSMEWELPPVAVELEVERMPEGRESLEMAGLRWTRVASEARLSSIQGYLKLGPPTLAPERPEWEHDLLAPRRAFSCEADNPCQADQSQCENRVACLQKTWKTDPPQKNGQDCLHGNLAECVKRLSGDPSSGGAKIACHDNSDPECPGFSGWSGGNQAVVCKEQAGKNRWEPTLLHELIHLCVEEQKSKVPVTEIGSETMAETCQNACFDPCPNNDPSQATGPCATYYTCREDQVPPDECDPTKFPRCEL